MISFLQIQQDGKDHYDYRANDDNCRHPSNLIRQVHDRGSLSILLTSMKLIQEIIRPQGKDTPRHLPLERIVFIRQELIVNIDKIFFAETLHPSVSKSSSEPSVGRRRYRLIGHAASLSQVAAKMAAV